MNTRRGKGGGRVGSEVPSELLRAERREIKRFTCSTTATRANPRSRGTRFIRGAEGKETEERNGGGFARMMMMMVDRRFDRSPGEEELGGARSRDFGIEDRAAARRRRTTRGQ